MISVSSKLFQSKLFLSLLSFFFFSASAPVLSQEQWIDFVVEKDSSMMTVSLDLQYYMQKPNYKNLVLVGTRFEPCMKNGFPLPDALEDLYSFSDSIAAVINQQTKNTLVGILTYKCLGFDVYYVKDTIDIRDKVEKTVIRNFYTRKTYLTVKEDKSWDYYFNFLLPPGLSEDFIIDQKYLFDLVLQGDDLQGLRKVRHWIYFNKLKQRLKMSEKLENLNFSIDSIKYHRGSKWPYEIQVSRQDSIAPQHIFDLTTMMKILTEKYQGSYDGWGTELIIEE